jgi:hypothetical protein
LPALVLGGVIWRLVVVRGGRLGELVRCCCVAASGPPDVTGNGAGDAKAYTVRTPAPTVAKLTTNIRTGIKTHLLTHTALHQNQCRMHQMHRPLNLDR